MKIIVTTTQSVKESDILLQEFLQETRWEFVPRRRKSLAYISREHESPGIVVWHNDGPVLHLADEKFFFHPSMAKIRINAYRNRQIIDPLIKAGDLKTQDSVLDCTLGMGADSIVAAYFTGIKVVGLEASFPVAMMVKWGMKTYHSGINWLDEAIHRIEAVPADHKTFLKSLPDDSFDIVYFDPMFRQPLMDSKPLAPLRLLADHDPLTAESLAEACRVARKRVVMKELYRSGEMQRLGFDEFVGSLNNPIRYGYVLTARSSRKKGERC